MICSQKCPCGRPCNVRNKNCTEHNCFSIFCTVNNNLQKSEIVQAFKKINKEIEFFKNYINENKVKLKQAELNIAEGEERLRESLLKSEQLKEKYSVK